MQDLVEYKDEHINELQESLDKLDERMETLERERDNLERNNEKFQKDISDTKNNMAHYRTSCQNLSKKLTEADENMQILQSKCEMLERQNNEAEMRRMDSGSSLGEIEDQLIGDGNGNEQPEIMPEEDEFVEDTLGDEFVEDTLGDELNELEGFDNGVDNNEVIEGDEIMEDDKFYHENDLVDENNCFEAEENPENNLMGNYEIESAEAEQILEEEMAQEKQIINVSAHEIELQTDEIPLSSRKIQTLEKE